jgi:hypothetical protein
MLSKMHGKTIKAVFVGEKNFDVIKMHGKTIKAAFVGEKNFDVNKNAR